MQNATLIQYFHWYTEGNGTLWERLKSDIPYLQSLGISAVWLPPAFKGSAGGYSVGYDVYDIYDLGEFDQKGSIPTKYGTRQQYEDAVKAAQSAGLQVYADIVLNHLAGADETEKMMAEKVDEEDRNHKISEPLEIEAYTKFTYSGRQKKYSDFEWNFMSFSGVDYAIGENGGNGIFKIINDYGYGWKDMIDDEKGNYDYLMYNDIEFRNPAVQEELNRWGIWYEDAVHFDGVRLDAVKHIPVNFYNQWLDHLRGTTGKEIFAIGEYWAPGSLHLLLRYIEATEGRMSLFDSSLHHNLYHASLTGKDYDMRTILDDTLVKTMPQKAVTVTDNHDTQPLQALEAPLQSWFKPLAYALILLRAEGYPCVFFPDLYGAHYTDKGKDGQDYEIFLDKVDELEKLLIARKEFAYGQQRDYFDHGNCIGWTREGDDEHSGCAVLLTNGDDGFKEMEIGSRYAGATFIDLLQKHPAEIKINESGKGEFFVTAGSVSVWVVKP